MGITGNLKTMALAELLQWLSQGQKTGTLVFDSGKFEKRVYFDHGTIFSSSSTDPAEYLGNFLVARGYVTNEQVDEALARQKEEGKLLGTLLVELGAVDEADLQEILQLKAEESIYETFTWEQGDFRFLDGELPEQIMVPMALDVQWLVLEGSRRLDELGRLRQHVPSPHAVAVAVVDLDGLEVEDTEARILSWVNDDRTVEEISHDAHTTQILVTQVLAAQVQAGTIKMVRPRLIEVEVPARADDPAAQPPSPQPLPMQPPVYAPMPGYPPSQYMPMPMPTQGAQNLDALRNHPSFANLTGFRPPQQPAAQAAPEAPKATPPAASTPSLAPAVAAAIEEGERAIAAGELDTALEAFRRAKEANGSDPAVAAAVSAAEKKLGAALANAGIAVTAVPRLSCDMTSLTQLKISPSEGFMLTRVNGSYDIKSLLKMHPGPALEVQVLFWRLKKSGHVAF